MIKSMTGYGRAVASINKEQYVVEIRALNGKSCDISLKTSLIPRDKEIEIRQLLSEKLSRGNIDLFISLDNNNSDAIKVINRELFTSLYSQITQLTSDLGATPDINASIATLIRVPDVIESQRNKFDDDEQWSIILNAIKDAIESIDHFRITEGKSLENDIKTRVKNILSFLNEIGKFESQRGASVKERILKRFEELPLSVDENRLEQEMIYYLEKFDINEEKVRLKQHCDYFIETMDTEEMPGKKMGFIAQEMGREINTLGSKANHADIQRRVVMMKEELEKIKEQSLNII